MQLTLHRRSCIPFFTILMLSLLLNKLNAAGPSNPNIIYILADDLGYGELGSYGQKLISTPRLDQMAKEGMLFTQFYAGGTVCAPSRSVLMTGQHQGRTRIRGNAGNRPVTATYLREEDFTIAELLRGQGYKTAVIGKWGLGNFGAAEAGLPTRQGFDYFFGYLNHTHAHNHFTDHLWRNEEKVKIPNEVKAIGKAGGGYATKQTTYVEDLFCDEAIAFVKQNKEKPFFLYWSMVVPHANNERRSALGDGANVPDYGPYENKDWPTPNKGHAAMITRMDEHVGRMLDQLRTLGLAENTLVLFSSDNGPHKESGHDTQLFKPSGPLRGFKRDLTEGGIRVPHIAWWPGKIKPGSVSAHVGYSGDLMATAAELANAKNPPQTDSISFLPTLLGNSKKQAAHEFLYWEFHERGFSQAVLYQGRWKAIRSQRLNAPLELYDLKNDLGENENIASKHPKIISKIENYLKTARSESADWPITSTVSQRD
ncbi:MAG: arylsulfatase [Limisphaerales bacterium]